ncbi:uncharacterized protein ColSpa_07906 [Colletotrichum spaethianum]|uniref:Uncharacterized protein n=1 Tax=Colletotrichum spaethianum TaxID=700344 RepID=A0AA37P8R3_9PEZI|nr:uncharacterized protein ColSpa_07906 [Colletotrichum spaethianum]GKT47725.1 hypothetical protein ColSpa_07906 [Colletotrichum spaethianum]
MAGRDTTAHGLSAALRNDEIPTDPRVLADFGFDKCFSGIDRAHLSMVYSVLMVDFGVRPNELNKWKAKGMKAVSDKIRAKFAAKKERVHELHHVWFLENQYIWDESDVKGRAKASASARKMIKQKLALQKKKKKDAFDWWS